MENEQFEFLIHNCKWDNSSFTGEGPGHKVIKFKDRQFHLIWSKRFVNIQTSCQGILNVQKDISLKALILSNYWIFKKLWILLSQFSCFHYRSTEL